MTDSDVRCGQGLKVLVKRLLSIKKSLKKTHFFQFTFLSMILTTYFVTIEFLRHVIQQKGFQQGSWTTSLNNIIDKGRCTNTIAH